RTTLLRMAGEAGVVQRRFLEEGWSDGAVRAVTRGTRHLAFAHRHVGGAHGLGTLLQVARAAGLDLVHPGELVPRADVVHQGVAVGAGHVAGLVTAALPEDALALGVTVDADLVAFRVGRGFFFGNRDAPALALASARLHVRFAGAMAVLARVLLGGVAGLVEEQTSHPRLGELVPRLLVAALAGLRPDVIAVGRGSWGSCGGCCRGGGSWRSGGLGVLGET